jgi:hypothetical protein
VGGLVGRNDGLGAVTNCHSSGAVSGDEWGIGGLVGENRGSITASYSAGTVRGKSSVGGLVGWSGGTVAECYSTGVVSGGQAVGGLAGSNGGGTITNSYAAGSVVGDSGIGGLAGTNGYGCETHWQCALSVISDCYSGGTVKGTEDVGGLVGSSWDFAVVIRCFWDTQTSGQPASDGGTGKTTGEMQMAATFLEAGWDFVNVWGIGENQTYPYLRKYSAADINQDASVNFLDLAVLAENWLTGVNN